MVHSPFNKNFEGFSLWTFLGTIILKPVSGPGTVTSHIEPNNLTILIHMPYGPTYKEKYMPYGPTFKENYMPYGPTRKENYMPYGPTHKE